MASKKRDPRITHKIMAAVKSKNTRPELALRKALWHRNHRYRVNYKKLPGKPDIVFTRHKIAVFCDGDFWHGHNWAIRGIASLEKELNSYSEYWKNKILKNIERDNKNNESLRSLGWKVIRIWESDIKKDLDACVMIIEDAMNLSNNQPEYKIDNKTSLKVADSSASRGIAPPPANGSNTAGIWS